MNPILEKIKNEAIVIFGREPWWAELWSAAAAILWSLISISSSFDTQQSVIAYQLSMLSSMIVWEITGLAIGLLQLFCLISGKMRCRWGAAFMASWWWVFLTISIYLGSENLMPVTALYFVHACINLFSMIKLVRQYA